MNRYFFLLPIFFNRLPLFYWKSCQVPLPSSSSYDSADYNVKRGSRHQGNKIIHNFIPAEKQTVDHLLLLLLLPLIRQRLCVRDSQTVREGEEAGLWGESDRRNDERRCEQELRS